MTLLGNFQKKWPLAPGARVLLALSGGMDSVCLGALMRLSDIRFGIAHANFQLRGPESEADARFAQALAEQWEVLFYTQKFDTLAYSEEQGISVQEAARRLRYAWFEDLREQHQFTHLVTAHQLNDHVETALFHFSRGTGLRGLSGIPSENGAVLRPLLFATRAEMAAFMAEQGLAWRDDSSNATDDYTRNFIRHHIVPRFEEINPDFLHTAGRNLQRLRELREHGDFLLRHFLGDTPLQLEKVRLQHHPCPQRLLHEWLRDYGFSEEQCRQMAALSAESGQEWHSDLQWRLMSERKRWVVQSPAEMPQAAIVVIHEDDLMVRLPDGGRLFLLVADTDTAFPEDAFTVLLDAERLEFPMQLRRWQAGDRFQPLGMGGQTQKLQDFFTHRKLSQNEKENTWLLCNGNGDIAWVLGQRLDERYKIGAFTNKVLKIRYVSAD
jgi:tRNA(Ile)-lysidine synthase